SFIKQEVTIMFNHCSGMLFLTNADYQVLMVYNGNLELFHTTPHKGIEGFKEELKAMIANQQITHPEDIDFILSLEQEEN
ncbi:hypothetical protein, partial [Apibacter muscae]|uniref:hypothetical protein n=1 Tax=Apibacter muscae TaxID=2509004 RepID=UPI0016287CFB